MTKETSKEPKDFEEIISNNNDKQTTKIKNEINRLVPSDIKLEAKNDSQKKLINSIKNNEITICAGPAGVGKTFLAVAYALSLLRKTTNRYKRIYLVKSVTPLKGEEIGYLKGNLDEKILPFFISFYINLEKVITSDSLKSLLEKEIIKPFPITYMRGVTLDDCIIVIDEAQNISLDNSRTLLTRIGSNSKIILLGDTNQIDLKNKDDSSLKTLINMFEDANNIGVVEMNEEDTNIRNPIITLIESKYREYIATSGISKTTKVNKPKKQLLLENNE